jgi:diguanylate cyclase (GGDEF)-like protein/PAS domain S-box-containing protein
MHETLVTLLDAISMVAFAAAFVMALSIPVRLMDRFSRAFLLLALGTYVFVGVSNILEHAGITAAFDLFEDYIEILFPLVFTYFLYSVITNNELTLRKKAEAELLASKERYQRIIEDLPDLVCRYRPDTTITFVNEAYANYFNKTVDELIGTSFLALVPSEVHDYIRSKIAALSQKSPLTTMEHEVITPAGKRRWQHWRDRALFDEGGAISEIQSIGQDITERKHMEERLRTLTLTDELTGLFNRRGFYAMAEQQVKLSRRMHKRTLLVSADLDNLKRINDTLGHQGGDAALVATADIIKRCFRRSDIVARVGGDEFVVLQLETTPIDPETLAQRLQKKIDERNEQGRDGCPLSVSFGIACFEPDSGLSIDEMLHRADQLMYEHKRLKQRI